MPTIIEPVNFLNPDARPPRRRSPSRRSFSPDHIDRVYAGGGADSARRRSPEYYQSRNGDSSGPSGASGPSRRGRDGESSRRDKSPKWGKSEYAEKDRERERVVDRTRYEDESGAVERQSPPKPNFNPSGLLAKETNTVKGVQLKYNEPPEARKPLKNWRLYVFKGTEQVDLIHIYRQSAYLIGRDTVEVTDIPIAHPSASKQHAAIQYRQITEKNAYGDVTTSVKPFIIDLESTNGTHVNDQEVPKSRYYELRSSDVIKFGTSSREYVLLHEDASA